MKDDTFFPRPARNAGLFILAMFVTFGLMACGTDHYYQFQAGGGTAGECIRSITVVVAEPRIRPIIGV